jgi:hypothetical protein
LKNAGLLSAIPVVVCATNKTWERKLSKLLSFVAVAALALSFSSGAKAQSAPSPGVTNAVHHHHWQPRKHTYGKRMRAHWGARCKMSGSC